MVRVTNFFGKDFKIVNMKYVVSGDSNTELTDKIISADSSIVDTIVYRILRKSFGYLDGIDYINRNEDDVIKGYNLHDDIDEMIDTIPSPLNITLKDAQNIIKDMKSKIIDRFKAYSDNVSEFMDYKLEVILNILASSGSYRDVGRVRCIANSLLYYLNSDFMFTDAAYIHKIINPIDADDISEYHDKIHRIYFEDNNGINVPAYKLNFQSNDIDKE